MKTNELNIINKNLIINQVNHVTIEQSFGWITQSFKAMTSNPKIFFINTILFGLYASLSLWLPPFISLIMNFFYFCIVGSAVLNVHNSLSMDKNSSSIYSVLDGFKKPFVSRLLLSFIYFSVAFLFAIVISIVYLYFVDFFSTQNQEILTSFFKDIVEVTSENMTVYDLRPVIDKYLNGDVGSQMKTIFLHLFAAIQIVLLLLLIISCYFVFVPFLAVIGYEDQNNFKPNMYGMSFRLTMKLSNWLAYLLYGFTIVLASVVFTGGVKYLVSFLPSSLYIPVLCFFNAGFTSFLVYNVYFMLCDLIQRNENTLVV